MDSKRIINAINEYISQGNLEKARLKLISSNIQLDVAHIIKLIITCSKACTDVNTSQEISDDDLVLFLSLIIESIDYLPNDRFDYYIRAIYYIMKFLIDKKSFFLIEESEKIILPKFVPLPLTDQHKSTYRSISMMLYECITNKDQSLDFPKENLYSFGILAAKIWVHSIEKHKYIYYCHHMLNSLNEMKLSHQKLKEYFLFVLRNYARCTDDSPLENQFMSLVTILQLQFFIFFKSNDFESSILCYREWEKIAENYFTTEEFIFLFHILQFPTLIVEPNCQNKIDALKQCHESLKAYYKMYKINECLKVSLAAVASIVSALVYEYLKKGDKSLWTENPENVQMKIFNLLSDVSQITVQISQTSAYSNCDKKLPLYSVIKLIGATTTLGKLYISNSKSVSKKFKQDILQFIEKTIPFIIALKENNIEEWKSCWSEVGISLYNMSFELYRIDDDDSLKFVNFLLQKLVLVEGTPQLSILGNKILHSSLILIAEVYFKSNELRKCLVITALILAICPHKRDSEITRWIKIKATSKESDILGPDDELQKLTIISALEKYKNEVQETIPNFSLDSGTKIELLAHEIDHYKQKWKSRTPMMIVYKELCSVADLVSLVDITLRVWYDFSFAFHEELPQLLHSTLMKYESSCGNSTKDVTLAFLYFTYYTYKFRNTIVKQNADVEACANYQESTRNNHELNADPNDECDIVSSYECLKIDKHVVLTKYLNKSLNVISSICKDKNYMKNFKNWSATDVFSLLIKISHEYRLHNNHLLYLQASELALKIAEDAGSEISILKAATNIIEIADVTKSYVKEIIQKADSVVPKVDPDCQESLKVLIEYFIARGNGYLYVDIPESDASFRQASLFHVLWKGKEDLILNAQLFLLQAKLIMLPCEFKIQGHNEFSLVQIHFAHACVMNFINKHSGLPNSFSLSVIFEVKEAMVRMYYLQKLPREVRCYGKDTAILAQKYLVPLRTASLLAYLAHADILSCRLDDCKVKMDGLADILCMSKYKSNVQQKIQKTSKINTNKVPDIAILDVNEVTLDVPQKVTKQLSPGSPTFILEPFKSPDFIKHDGLCDCFACMCLEYQTLVLQKIHLDAVVNTYQDNMALSQGFFSGGIALYKELKSRKENYLTKALKFVHNDLVTNPEDFHLEAYCYLLYDNGNSLLKLRNKKTPRAFNRELIHILKPNKLKYIYLYNEVLLQKIHIYHEMPPDEDPISSLKVGESHNMDLLRTPESKCSKVTFALKCSPKPPTSPPERAVKSIYFNLDDIEENLPVVKKDPTSLFPKTPLPKNIRVYPPAFKSASKKKPLSDISVPNNSDVANKAMLGETAFLASANSDAANKAMLGETAFLASTSFCIKEDKETEKLKSGLRNRTKLLTQKLQNDRKAAANDENIASKESKEETINAPRKKLFSLQNAHSSSESSEINSGAVRRSTRRKK